MNRMRKKRWFVFIPFIVAAVLLVVGFVVMQLWNGIVSPVLHVGELGYGQAIGLLVLCRILFGGFGRGGFGPGGPRWRGGPWREKWMNMSEEEKAAFREQWQRRCGPPPSQEK